MKAAILDFDGVIADTLQLNFEVKKAAFLPYGVELTLKEFIDIWVSPEKGKEGTPYFVRQNSERLFGNCTVEKWVCCLVPLN